MATLEDLKLHHRIFAKNYPFRSFAVKDNPVAELEKPLDKSKFALVTTAGLMLSKDKRFSNTIKLGDTSFREIPNDVEVRALFEDRYGSIYDHDGIREDRNVAFPLDRFRELENEGEIGGLNSRHISFKGSIVAPRKLIKKTAPEAAKLLVDDGVDAVFLTPV